MKRIVLLVVMITLAQSANALTTDEVKNAAQLMLAFDGVTAIVDYKISDGSGNTWLVAVKSSDLSDMDTLRLALVTVENLDHQIPSKTDAVLIMINGMIYQISMPELRRCVQGVGFDGFSCAKQYIKAGKHIG